MSRAPYRAAKTRAETVSPASIITNTIIAKLEAGVSPWRRTWSATASTIRPMRACGLPYRGINVVWLWAVAEERGYTRSTWMTYRQAQEYGGQVRRGERGTLAVFYKAFSATETDGATGEESSSIRRVLRTYTVFNVDQIDNLPDRFCAAPPPPVAHDEAHRATIDAFISASGAKIVSGGSEACYYPAFDYIRMPHAEVFETYAEYGATAAHELSHWTGHPSRLDRNLNNRFGSDNYAVEEMIAELSAALLGADLGLPVTHLDNHASYISHWLTILRKDERALLTVAAKAEDAAAYLMAKAGRSAVDENSETPDAAESDALDIAA